jgi:hypothetical protein
LTVLRGKLILNCGWGVQGRASVVQRLRNLLWAVGGFVVGARNDWSGPQVGAGSWLLGGRFRPLQKVCQSSRGGSCC